jgi:hypothetical protein
MAKPKRRSQQSGRSGTAASVSRPSTSAAPVPAPTVAMSKLKLRFNLGPTGGSQTPGPSLPPLKHDDPAVEDEQELPIAQAEGTTRRSGREGKKRRDADYIYDSDLIDQPDDLKKADDEDYVQLPSSPREYYSGNGRHKDHELMDHTAHDYPEILELAPETSRRARDRPSKNPPHRPSLFGSQHENIPSSDSIVPASLGYRPSVGLFKANINPDIYDTLDYLRSTSEIHLNLPQGRFKGNDVPYTARTLMHLYLVCYESHLWNLCDMITDTWIRAFHALRRKGQRDPNSALWRRNPQLETREQEARVRKNKGMKPMSYDAGPDYNLTTATEDPLIADQVTTQIDSGILNELYDNTAKDSGARLLWADALALGGDKVEDAFARTKEEVVWHPDLLFNLACTSTRMVRRKLTLRIEESTEGAWCKRYHEHTRQKLPCYRQLAAEQRARNGDVGMGHGGADDALAAMMEQELEKEFAMDLDA